jgi:hypothetical protein
MNKVCGVQLIKNGVKYDYCFKESIQSMLNCCDQVIVSYIPGEDTTLEVLESINDDRLKILHLTEDDWNMYNDKYRLSYLTNVAIQEADRLGFQYILSVQSDEVLHEDSYLAVRRAVNDNHEGYLCTRVNLWKSPDLELNVPQERLPCSNEVVRLAKISYRAFDDAESLFAPGIADYLDEIKIIHYGFVRKKEVMKSKIINMQEGVFGMGHHDPKLDEEEIFNPDLWFDPSKDLVPINFKHPVLIQDWVNERK